jgi:hypothetical protein
VKPPPLNLSVKPPSSHQQPIPSFHRQNRLVHSTILAQAGIIDLFAPNAACTVQWMLVYVSASTTVQLLLNGSPYGAALSVNIGAVIRFAGTLLVNNEKISLSVSSAATINYEIVWIKEFYPDLLVRDTSVTNGANSGIISGVVSVSNFPATQPVSGAVSVSNFPATQPVSGAVSVSNFPATQPVSGAVSVSNFPATQPVSGAVSVSNFPATQPVSGAVSVSNFPATQPVSSADSTRVAYSCVITSTVPISGSIFAAFGITGSGKIARIRSIELSGTKNALSEMNLSVIKNSTRSLLSGSPGTTSTSVPHDSSDGAAQFQGEFFGAAPTAGTLIGAIRGLEWSVPTNTIQSQVRWTFGDNEQDKPLILRGNEEIAFIVTGALTTPTFVINIEWTEE